MTRLRALDDIDRNQPLPGETAPPPATRAVRTTSEAAKTFWLAVLVGVVVWLAVLILPPVQPSSPDPLNVGTGCSEAMNCEVTP